MRAEQERMKSREAENFRQWRTITGNWTENPVERIGTRKRVFFEAETRHSPLVSVKDPSRMILDRLIGLCFSDAEYLRHEDAARYIAFLNELKQFVFVSWRRREPTQIKVEDLPVEELGQAIAEWVPSYFKDGYHPLMPAYALDTAIFIEAHVNGRYQSEPELWEIKAMVEMRERDIFRSIDTAFKSHFTSRFGGTVVRCRVPQDCAVRCQDKILIPAGEEFCAAIKRCHLSSSFQDAIFLHCDTPVETSYRINLNFEFVGEILLDARGSFHNWMNDPQNHPINPILFPDCGEPFYRSRGFDLAFPASWISAAIEDLHTQPRLVPAPRWDAEIGSERRFTAIEEPTLLT